jgi:excisionase family DNA binding protein
MHTNMTTSVNGRRAYRISEATSTFGLSKTTLYKLIKSGQLRSVKVAGCRVIPADAIEALLSPSDI